jgi:hypothetical protein
MSDGALRRQGGGRPDPVGGEPLSADERAELVRLRTQVAEVGEGHRFPGKSLGVPCGAASKVSRFELIAAECASHDVTRMAQLLGVSTSGYDKHRQILASDCRRHVKIDSDDGVGAW